MRRTKLTYISVFFLIFLLSFAATGCGGKARIPKEYDYSDLNEYIKLGEYKGLEYTKISGDVSEEEVNSYINDKLAEGAEQIQLKEGTVKEDSVVNIDYVGSIDGVEFEGGTAQGVDLDIANSGYIDGFAEGIVGHNVGETFDLNVTFPEDYGKEELNGKPAVFKTTINYILETKTPELNDTWVSENTTYKTVREYKESVKEELKEQKLSTAKQAEYENLFAQILNSSELIKIPEKELEIRKEELKTAYGRAAMNSGQTLSQYLELQGMTEEQFDTIIASTAENTVRNELVLHQIARLEDIEITSKEYNEYLKTTLERAGYTAESFKEERGMTIEEYAEENNLFTSCLYEKVMEKVMEYSVEK